MRKNLLVLGAAAALSAPAFAADYTDGDIHKNDYSWSQFNLMYSDGELPGESDHDYIEMEFGGRSGIVDLYGYLDIFNITSDQDSDKQSNDKMFLKLAPRFSLDAMTGNDLSFGPVKEVYISTLFNISGGVDADGTSDVNNYFAGIGADVEVPWFGKVGVNLYALYDQSNRQMNGYQFSTNWFKPFKQFDNSFIAYQGYLDYQFGMDNDVTLGDATSGGAMFNGIYWHSDRYSVGYGLKSYNQIYGIENGASNVKSTGNSHYVAFTYKI
ncbi:outer membrane protein OmpK [Marinomonas sp. PE14-40]|uniref:nucleoside-specific channel-forming Tsx family protein n=1 Tax=Marinomonas sp. PE14-40 TaxID=3060621 RepID=UPI003F67D7C8